MAYNKAKAERKWHQLKEIEEQQMRLAGIDEEIIQKIRGDDWEEFKSNRRYYERLQDISTYFEQLPVDEPTPQIDTVYKLLDEIESKELYQILLSVDKLSLQIVLYKMEGYSTHEISVLLQLSEKAVYRRLDRLKEKLKKFL